ncbi:MAG: LytR C-terminal domain-containing protein [Solirubrobacterales bacterium]
MIDLIEGIGPILGIVAFVGLAILAFLIFQQAREVRRLREWAGRAPERAAEAAEASLAAAEARGEQVEVPGDLRPSRVSVLRDRAASAFAPRWEQLDRRLPVDPRYLVATVVAAVIAAGVLTSGFGVFGGDGGEVDSRQAGGGRNEEPERPEVTVLNATQVESSGGTIQGVPQLASTIADQVVKPAGYPIGREDNAASGFEETLVMYEPKAEGDAAELARAINDELGETATSPMIQEVRDLAGGAPLALVVGQDDSSF